MRALIGFFPEANSEARLESLAADKPIRVFSYLCPSVSICGFVNL